MNTNPRAAAGGDADDPDPLETAEWLDALDSVAACCGAERAEYLLRRLDDRARELGVGHHVLPYSAYRNTIPLERQATHPGDVALEERITAIIRWNALAMVVRANLAHGELGGHIASFASAAEIFETGFNHFFRGADAPGGSDLVFFQPHSSPGVYARAFLEGRLSAERLAHYRQELAGGLSSYPHPWLMPDFWQFPTGSMGIGPINSIYQARFLRYLEHRQLAPASDRRVWAVIGDGEMDEPESVAGLTLAAREGLDNLTWIVNCNLQRLDGPVRGNGQIIQELESLFVGAGWNVVKVLWGSDWDPLFARDRNHALLRQFARTVDGEYQTLGANDGAYNHEHFFSLEPDLRELVAHMSPAEIDGLKRGGHDFRKLYAAFDAARRHHGAPTVILAKTKKGYGMGRMGESRMNAHMEKKIDVAALLEFRDRFELPLTNAQVESLEFYRPPQDSAELAYLQERRAALGGALPARRRRAKTVPVPALDSYGAFALDAGNKVMSTTMVAVRLLTQLLRDPNLGRRIVPIVADEARTFGMASLFRQIGIYSPVGQLYTAEDADSLLAYREAKDGQLLEEGITEAGAISSWIAAGTAYSVHGLPLLPVYIFYSMFGFQRVGDLIWAAADQRTRGFLLGATAGRTTLGGEGLQHQDGSSLLVAATVPNCRAYDPAFAGELAVILDQGARQMLAQDQDVFYYVTVMNESYPQPSLPDGVREDVLRGLYCLRPAGGAGPKVRLVGSGTILREVLLAADRLRDDWGVDAEVWSATSFSELAREAQAVERTNRGRPVAVRTISHVARCLGGTAPVVAATDYVRAWPQLVAPYVPARFVALGTDGFGRSDTRARLRRFFEVDAPAIVIAALDALAESGSLQTTAVREAAARYGVDLDCDPSWSR